MSIGIHRRTFTLRPCVLLLCWTLFQCSAWAQSGGDLASSAIEALQTGNYERAEGLFSILAGRMPGEPEIYSNLGLSRYYEGKSAAAREAFDKALALNANLLVPNLFLARLDCDEARCSDATPMLRRAARLQRGDPETRQLIGDLFAQAGIPNEAIVQYRDILKQNPKDEAALSGLIRAFLEQDRRLSLALRKSGGPYALLLRAETDSALRPGDSAAYEMWRQVALPRILGLRIALADFLIKSGHLDEAKTSLGAEIEIDPNSYKAFFRLSGLALLRNDLGVAVKEMDRAAQIRPEFFTPLPPLSLYPNLPGQSYAALQARANLNGFGRAYLLGQLAERAGYSDEANHWKTVAEKQLRVDITRVNRSIPAQMKRATYAEKREFGLEALRNKRTEVGLRVLMAMAGLRSDEAVQVAILRALVETEQFEQAADFFEQHPRWNAESFYLAITSYRAMTIHAMNALAMLDPQSITLERLSSESLSDRGLYREAAQELRDAVKAHPQDPGLYFSLGEAYYNQMQFQQAEQAYARAMELRPSDPLPYVMCAHALVELGKPHEAIQLSDEALQIDPQLLQAHVSKGRALALLGRNSEAAQELEMGASTDQDGAIHYELVQIYRKLGRLAEQKRALQIFLELHSHSRSPAQIGAVSAAHDPVH